VKIADELERVRHALDQVGGLDDGGHAVSLCALVGYGPSL
jgi:hypothetical protein